MSPPPTTTTTSASTPEPESERILDDTPVEVAVIGSGVCGVLAAAELRRRDGAQVRVLEASPEGPAESGGRRPTSTRLFR